jgi:hypothetical protein
MPDSDLPPDELDIALEEKDAAPLTFPGSAADLPDMMEILSTQIPSQADSTAVQDSSGPCLHNCDEAVLYSGVTRR